MTDETRARPSLKAFDAYADRNGQDLGSDSPLDIGLPSRTQGDLQRDPGGEAEAARLASGTPRQDATDATEAETPPEPLRRLKEPGSGSDATAEAIERATAAFRPEGPRLRGDEGPRPLQGRGGAVSEDRTGDRDKPSSPDAEAEKKPANIAPDAVKDPNEKTGGHPGAPPQGDETDPGAG